MKCLYIYIYIYKLCFFSLLLPLFEHYLSQLPDTIGYGPRSQKSWCPSTRVPLTTIWFQVPGFIVLSSRRSLARPFIGPSPSTHSLPAEGSEWGCVEGLGPYPTVHPSFHLYFIWWCISRFSIIWWSTVLMVYNTQHFLVYNMAMVIMTCVLVMSYLDWTSNVILQLLLHNKKHVCYC